MADPLSVAASIAGLVSIADTVFTRTYRYARGVKNAEKDIAELASGIRSLSGLLHGLALVIEELQKETTSETNFRLHHINACRATLTKVENKLEKLDPATPRDSRTATLSKRLKWPFSSSETKELIVEVERHKSTIGIALSADTLSTVFQALSRQNVIAEGLSELKSELKSRWAAETHIALGKERKEVLDYFGKVDSTLNHQTNLKLRHPLTGLWVTEGETFRSWLRIRNSKLWLSGVAGGGKTILAASLIEETMDDSSSNQAVAYYYCDYRDPEKQKPLNIIGSLAAQIGRQAEEAFELLQGLYKTCHPEDRASISPELVHLTATVLEMSHHFEEVSIIVDGLDECGTSTAMVIESLNKLVSNHQSNIRLLILSREDLGIREVLEKGYTYLEIAAKSKDLELYVAAELEARKGAGRGKLRIRSQELREHIMKTLVERAAGMFRWVSCQIDYLCACPTDAEKRMAINMLPPTLHETYERILDGVNQSGEGVQKMVQATLRWIVTSRGGSLAVDAICEAISIQVGVKHLDKESVYDEEAILSHCGSLLQVGEGFELAHFTVKEFLTSIKPESPFAQYSQNEQKVHPLLAKTCLTYIMLDPFQSDIIEDFDEWKLQQMEYPLRAHAVRYWFDYARLNWDDKEMVTLAQELFNPSKTLCFLSWARDYLYLYSSAFLNSSHNEAIVFRSATYHVLTGGVTPLHIAAALGASELCSWILTNGTQINQTSDLGTPIHCALAGFDLLSELLVSPESFLLHSKRNLIVDDRVKVLSMLIEKGADFNKPFKDTCGREHSCALLALNSSTKSGSDHPLNLLVKAGVKLEKNCLVPFEQLCSQEENAHGEFIKALVENLKLNEEEDDVRSAILDIALQSKHFSGLERIERNTKGLSHVPLHELQERFFRAIRFDQTETMEFLLRESQLKLPFTHGEWEETPLHYAADHEAINAVKLLLSLGESVDATDNEGNTPLHLTVMAARRDDACTSILLDHGASLIATDRLGRTAWHVAAKLDDTTALKVFSKRDKEKDKSLSTPEEKGLVPLFYAAKYKRLGAVKLLLAEPFITSRRCPLGMSIVHYVTGMNSLGLLTILQSKGVSLQDRTTDGRTALHFIPQDVDPAVIRFLLGCGLSPATTANDGSSPLHRLILDELSDDMEVLNLLATDETISLQNKNGHTPYYYALLDAASDSSRPVCRTYVEFLKSKHIDLTICCGKMSLTVLTESYTGGILRSDHHFFEILLNIVECTTDVELLNQQFPWKYHRDDSSLTTFLYLAITSKAETVAKELLSKGASVDLVVGPLNYSAVHYASCHQTSIDLYSNILVKSKRVNSCSTKGYYLQHLVCFEDSAGTALHLKELGDLGLDINLQATNAEGPTPLMLAAECGNVALVEWLLEQGVDYNATNNHGGQATHYACFENGFPALLAFKSLHVQWDSMGEVEHDGVNIGRCTVLHLAAVNVARCLQIVLENNFLVDINCLSSKGESALHLAAIFGQTTNVEQLLSAGANIEIRSSYGGRPIHVAAQNGNIEVVRKLLEHKCDLGADSDGLTPELHAMRNGHSEIARFLKERRLKKENGPTMNPIRIQTSGERKQTPSLTKSFKFAIISRDFELCKSLVLAGYDLQSFGDCKGCNPFLLALLLGDLQISRYLLDEGATTLGQVCHHLVMENQTAPFLLGYTAVHLVCREKIISSKLLSLILAEDLKAGSPAFHTTVSPLHVAVACQNHETVKLLLEHEPKIRQGVIALSGPQTALEISGLQSFQCESAITPITDIKIDRKSLKWTWILSYSSTGEINTNGTLNTALHLATFHNNYAISKTLLEIGAKTNLVNDQSETPLHIAALYGSPELCNLLLQHGSNQFARTRDGKTAVDLAITSETSSSFEIMSSLLDRGNWDSREFSDNFLRSATSSPSKFSHLFYRGFDPYSKRCSMLYNSVESYFIASDKIHSFMLNLGLDFSRCQQLRRAYFESWPASSIKVTLKLLKNYMVNIEYNGNSWDKSFHTPLNSASRAGRVDLLDLYFKAGADLELVGDSFGTPLIAACTHGRLDAVKYLVRAGANIVNTGQGRFSNAIDAAKHFEELVHWLLVGRFTDQLKIAFHPQNPEQEIQGWTGARRAEVIVDGWYLPLYAPSSVERAKELSELKRNIQGQTVEIMSFVDPLLESLNMRGGLSPILEDEIIEEE